MKLPTFLFSGRNKYYSIGTIVLILIIISFIFNGNGGSSFPFTIKQSDFVNTVKVTGKAVFDDRADLGFDKNGRISAIYKKVGDKVGKGDIIASIDNGDINAELAQKQAAVDRERAKLDSTLQGTRPEQLKIYQQSYSDATNALITAIRSSYLNIESALLTQVDTLFTNGSSVNPIINILTVGDSDKKDIEAERLLTNEAMNDWKDSISSLNSNPNSTNTENTIKIAASTISKAKIFMDKLGKIALDLDERGSYSEGTVNDIRNTVNEAAQNISSASNVLITAETAYNSAKDNFVLAQSGSTDFDKSAQQASLRSAEADLANVRARISSTIISAPFAGIVTRVDTKLGEVVSPADSPVTIMNLDSLIIEAYIPEININQVNIGNKALVTFDAFGDEEKYEGSVISIDLAETMRDGVATYKIQVKLDNPASYIRSGMTSDVVITTNTEENIISIPRGYLLKENNQYFLFVGKDSGSAKKVAVEIQEIGSLSKVKILSGVSDGDTILPPPASE